MKKLFLLLVLMVSSNLTAHQEPQISEEILNACETSIVCVIEERAYLRSEKLICIEGEWFLQNDLQQSIPLGTIVLKDSIGYYLYAAKIECPNGHTGFKRKNWIWYCFNTKCPYFFGDNF